MERRRFEWLQLPDQQPQLFDLGLRRFKAHELEQLLPWNWKAEQLAAAVSA